MTIEEIIKSFDYIKHVGNGESTYEHCREEIALNEAIATMRKYQKIQEIVAKWKVDSWTDNLSYECMIKIAEIIDNSESEEV